MPKKRTWFHYTVTGTGVFPFDMLRYDSAWPRYEAEVGLVGRSRADSNYNVPRTVHVTGVDNPTTERWKSFGWEVSEISTFTPYD